MEPDPLGSFIDGFMVTNGSLHSVTQFLKWNLFKFQSQLDFGDGTRPLLDLVLFLVTALFFSTYPPPDLERRVNHGHYGHICHSDNITQILPPSIIFFKHALLALVVSQQQCANWVLFLPPQYAPSASYSSGANYGGGGGSGGGFSAFGAGGGRGSGYPYAKSWGPQREVTVIKKDSEGLGISIVGGKVSHIVHFWILAGSIYNGKTLWIYYKKDVHIFWVLMIPSLGC